MRSGFVLGIDFGGTHVALAAMRDEKILRRTRLDSSGTAAQIVGRSVAAAQDLVAHTPGDLRAVGVATFGVVRDGQVILAPNIPGWEGLALPRLLRDGFAGTPLAIENDVKAAAAAELRWGRLTGVDTGVYLNLGTGLSAGVVAGGRVLRGAHGVAGEIAYQLRTPGDPGHAAGRAPLEEVISGAALARRGTALLHEPVTAADLFARHREPAVRALLDESLNALSMAVANLCIALDPELVVIGGGLMGASAQILPRLRTAIAGAVPYPPDLEPARFVTDAPLYGALTLALDTAGGPTPGTAP